MHKSRLLTLLVVAAAVVACDKNGVQNITAPATGAGVKFFNFGVTAPALNFFANANKVTGGTSPACQPPNDTTTVCKSTGIDTIGVVYSAAGSGGLYNAITPGQTTLTGKIAVPKDKGLAISTASVTLADGKYYSYYVSGIYDPVGKTADAFVVEDPIPANIDPTQTYVRFVNAVSNSKPMTLYATSTTSGSQAPVGGAIAYKSAGTFIAMPGGVYNLTASSADSTNVVTRSAVSFNAGRVYTVSSRGDMTSTVTATKPALDNTANR